jgi:hypothetical protein
MHYFHKTCLSFCDYIIIIIVAIIIIIVITNIIIIIIINIIIIIIIKFMVARMYPKVPLGACHHVFIEKHWLYLTWNHCFSIEK